MKLLFPVLTITDIQFDPVLPDGAREYLYDQRRVKGSGVEGGVFLITVDRNVNKEGRFGPHRDTNQHGTLNCVQPVNKFEVKRSPTGRLT